MLGIADTAAEAKATRKSKFDPLPANLSPELYKEIVVTRNPASLEMAVRMPTGHETAPSLARVAATPACAVAAAQRPVPMWSSPANRRPTNMLFHSLSRLNRPK